MPNTTKVTRSGKSWLIKYDFYLGNRVAGKRLTRTIQVNSTYQPTRTAAEDYARADLLSPAVLGHGHGQYGYTGLRIMWIGKVQPVLNSTKQKAGTPAAVTQTVQSPAGNPFV